MLIRALAVVSVLGLSLPVFAQTPCTASCPVTVNQPFTVLFDAPSQPPVVTGYRLYLDGVKVGTDISTSANPVTVHGVRILTPGPHAVEVSALSGSEEGPKTPPLALMATATDTTSPSPVTQLRAVPTTTQVTLNWDPATDNVGVVDYGVARGTLALGIVTGLTFTESSLTPATSYTYSVTAYDAARNASPAASVTTQTLTTTAACTSQGKPYSITIAVQSYSQKVAIGGRGLVSLTLSNSFPVTQIQVKLGLQVVGEITGEELRDITGIGFSVPRIPATYPLFVSATDALGCVTSTTASRPLVVQ